MRGHGERQGLPRGQLTGKITMPRKQTSESGIVNPRVILALVLCSVGIFLAVASFTGVGRQSVGRPEKSNDPDERRERDKDRSERYMPVPGGEIDDLDDMEVDWHNRLTYPTGRFDPAWVRQAAADDARIARRIPLGTQEKNLNQTIRR